MGKAILSLSPYWCTIGPGFDAGACASTLNDADLTTGMVFDMAKQHPFWRVGHPISSIAFGELRQTYELVQH